MAQYTPGWITVPGKGKRWRDASGGYSIAGPNPFYGGAGAGTVFGDAQDFGASLGHLLSKMGLKMAPGPAYELSGPGLQQARRRSASGGVSSDPPPDLNAGMTGANWPAGVPKPGTAVDPSTWPAGVPKPGTSVDPSTWQSASPGLGAPVAYGDPAARARESEQRRMMQQYAFKEYWDTEEGKAKRDLALQDRYEGKDLAGYYGAQKAVGIGGFDEVISGLEQRDARYAKGGDLRAWAEANKELALREYLKQNPAMEERGGPDRIAVEQAIKGGTFYAADGSPNPLGGKSQLLAGVDPGITMGPPADEKSPEGGPKTAPTLTPGGYVPDDRVIGMNAQGQTTVGEGAYGFDPAYDQLEIAKPLVEPEAARASNLAPTTQTAQQQKADELFKTFANRTRAAMIGN